MQQNNSMAYHYGLQNDQRRWDSLFSSLTSSIMECSKFSSSSILWRMSLQFLQQSSIWRMEQELLVLSFRQSISLSRRCRRMEEGEGSILYSCWQSKEKIRWARLIEQRCIESYLTTSQQLRSPSSPSSPSPHLRSHSRIHWLICTTKHTAPKNTFSFISPIIDIAANCPTSVVLCSFSLSLTPELRNTTAFPELISLSLLSITGSIFWQSSTHVAVLSQNDVYALVTMLRALRATFLLQRIQQSRFWMDSLSLLPQSLLGSYASLQWRVMAMRTASLRMLWQSRGYLSCLQSQMTWLAMILSLTRSVLNSLSSSSVATQMTFLKTMRYLPLLTSSTTLARHSSSSSMRPAKSRSSTTRKSLKYLSPIFLASSSMRVSTRSSFWISTPCLTYPFSFQSQGISTSREQVSACLLLGFMIWVQRVKCPRCSSLALRMSWIDSLDRSLPFLDSLPSISGMFSKMETRLPLMTDLQLSSSERSLVDRWQALFLRMFSESLQMSGSLQKSEGSPRRQSTSWPCSMISCLASTSLRKRWMAILRSYIFFGLWLVTHVVLSSSFLRASPQSFLRSSWRASSSLKRTKIFCLMDLILTSTMQAVYLNMWSFLSSVPRIQTSGRRSRRLIFFRNSTPSPLTLQRTANFSSVRCSAFMSSLKIFWTSTSRSSSLPHRKVQLSPSPFCTLKVFLQKQWSSFSMIVAPPFLKGTEAMNFSWPWQDFLATMSSVLRRQRVASTTCESLEMRVTGSSRTNSVPGSEMTWGSMSFFSISRILQLLTTLLSFSLLLWLTSSKRASTRQTLGQSGWSGGVLRLTSFMMRTYLGRRWTGLMRQSLRVRRRWAGARRARSRKSAKGWRAARRSTSCELSMQWLRYSKYILKKCTSRSTRRKITLQCQYSRASSKIVTKNSSFSLRIWSTFMNTRSASSLLMMPWLSRGTWKSDTTTPRSRMQFSSVSSSSRIIIRRLKRSPTSRRTRPRACTPRTIRWIRTAARTANSYSSIIDYYHTPTVPQHYHLESSKDKHSRRRGRVGLQKCPRDGERGIMMNGGQLMIGPQQQQPGDELDDFDLEDIDMSQQEQGGLIQEESQDREGLILFNASIVDKIYEIYQRKNKTSNQLSNTALSLTDRRVNFVRQLIQSRGYLSHNQILIEMSKADYLHSYTPQGQKIPITKQAITSLIRSHRVFPSDFFSDDPVADRYLYARRYLQLTEDSRADICFVGEFSFASNCSLSSCPVSRRHSFVNDTVPTLGKRAKVGKEEEGIVNRNIQVLLVMSLRQIVHFQLYSNIFAECHFLQTITDVANTIKHQNSTRPKKYLVLQTNFFHSKQALRTVQHQTGVKIIFLPPQTPMLNPTEYLFNELRHQLKSKTCKPHPSFKSAVAAVLRGLRERSMQGYYSCIGPYLELSLLRKPFK